MAYSDFTLTTVRKQFGITVVEEMGFFEEIKGRSPSNLLKEIFLDNKPLALASNTEKARSELLIMPILVELRRQLNKKISVFSGINFNVEPEKGLNGSCDFLIAQSQELLTINAPIIALVEAKKEDLNIGIGQCIAEMIAAQIFNEKGGKENKRIYGVVTSGTNWRFLKLEGKNVLIDLQEYYVENLEKILGILIEFCQED